MPDCLKGTIMPRTLLMVSSHSVHLLMNINLSDVGRALCDNYRPPVTMFPPLASELPVEPSESLLETPVVKFSAVLEDQGGLFGDHIRRRMGS